jgi:DNA-binding protein H-NS
MIRKLNLDAMSIDEMWQLHEKITEVLSVRLTSEKRELEKRLAKLRHEKDKPLLERPAPVDGDHNQKSRPQRKYAKVVPKYRNPNEPSETWSGRGKQPRWLTAALLTGHKIEEFVITTGDSSITTAR